MKDEVQHLLTQLMEMLPMPDDPEPSDSKESQDQFDLAIARYDAIVAQLAEFRDPRCIEPLLASFGYVDGNEVYQRTLTLLAGFETELLEPYLLAALRHENRGTRYWAVMMVMQIRYQAAIPDLLALLDDEAEHVRVIVVIALGAIGGAPMYPYIERLSDDPSDEVRYVVHNVLTDWKYE